MNISILCTCNGFWQRFELCRTSWFEALKFKPLDCQTHFEVITLEDIGGDKYPFNIYRIDPTSVRNGNLCESKPQMIYQRLVRQTSADYILFTDADILVPKDLFKQISHFNGEYAIADRLEANENETKYIISQKIVPPTVTSKEPIPKKRGMGWFQLVNMKLLSRVWNNLNWQQDGYDVFDWELNKALSEVSTPQVIQCEYPFIHLWHGDPGSTWKGLPEGIRF